MNEPDTIRLMLSTDCHLGYLERHPIRGKDSFKSFEEMLQHSKTKDVDMILLGGDLFHDNKPSRETLHSCMQLLRHYCMGDNRPCMLEVLSDPKKTFHSSNTVNFADPNYNIQIPVFTIHGNHDDPTGERQLSAIDLLASCNLVNYFGKSARADEVDVYPVLIQKGKTKLAIYGIGSIRDERLHRVFINQKVKFFRPRNDPEQWFNILVIHQNRVKHGETNYIPEGFLPDFFDLVFWGHEHECDIRPAQTAQKTFYITQPGSSVATSLSEGEAVKKHVGLLKINERKFQLQEIPLKTVRPFFIKDVVLSQCDIDITSMNEVETFLAQQVNSMLRAAKKEFDKEHADDTDPPPMPLPLIRIRVEYTGSESFSTHRFAQQFIDKVANPKEILHFFRKRVLTRTKASAAGTAAVAMPQPDALNSAQIEDMVGQFLDGPLKMRILSKGNMREALKKFVDKDDRDSIKDFVDWKLKRTRVSLFDTEAQTDDDLVRELGDDEEDDDGDSNGEPEVAAAAVPDDGESAADSSSRPASRVQIDAMRVSDDDYHDELDNDLDVVETGSTTKRATRTARASGRSKVSSSSASTSQARSKATAKSKQRGQQTILDMARRRAKAKAASSAATDADGDEQFGAAADGGQHGQAALAARRLSSAASGGPNGHRSPLSRNSSHALSPSHTNGAPAFSDEDQDISEPDTAVTPTPAVVSRRRAAASKRRQATLSELQSPSSSRFSESAAPDSSYLNGRTLGTVMGEDDYDEDMSSITSTPARSTFKSRATATAQKRSLLSDSDSDGEGFNPIKSNSQQRKRQKPKRR